MSRDRSQSSVREDRTPIAAREVQQFAHGLLKGLRFRGTFVEKRYVPGIKTYRSVIHINCEENALIRILVEVKNRINKLIGEHNPDYWIGVTQSDDQHFLWVNLTEEILGEYFFNIRAFDIDDSEAKVRLRQDRVKKETTPQPELKFNDIGAHFIEDTIKPIVSNMAADISDNMKKLITFDNIKDASSFVIIAMVAIVTGAFYTAKYLLEYSLRFTREFSVVLKNLTPTILSLIDLVKYVVFGLYWVIVALFRSNQSPPYNSQPYGQQRIQYNDYNGAYVPKGRRAIQNGGQYNEYHYRGATITELD